jgi:UDP-GlcNAc:undecaprenyl-phosphate GlcNAc-1-phosphate transferase
MLTDLLAFVIALVAAATFTPGARHLAFSIGLVDMPGPRKVHGTPMPLLGGLVVYIATVFAIAVFVADEAWAQMLGIFVAATLALVIGTLDDRGFLHHQVKLMVAMPLAAVILIATGMHSSLFNDVPSLPVIGLPGLWLDYALSFAWIVGITAAFSILDHMDGLCAGTAAVACIFFFFLSEAEGQLLISTLAVTLAGASLGFLRWNFNPARIFLGDGGAMFTGLMMATLGIKLTFHEVPRQISWLIPVLVLLVPIFDTTLVSLSRLRRGHIPFSTPGKDHVAHRLVSWGLSHRRAVLIMYALGAVGGVLAVAMRSLTVPQGLGVGAVVAVAALAAIAALERAPYERQAKA